MANFYKKPFIYLPPKKKKKEDDSSSVGKVGVPYEYRTSGSVSIGQMAVTWWLTPFKKRTPTVPELILWGQTIYYNAVYTTSAARVSMFSFERRINTVISSIETALGKLRFFAAGTGNDLNYSPFAACYFVFANDTNGHDLYKVNFTASVHNIFQFQYVGVDVRSVDADVYSVPVYKLASNSPGNFTTLYNTLDGQGVLPADKVIKFLFFPIGHNFTDEEVKNICAVYWGMTVQNIHTVTV